MLPILMYHGLHAEPWQRGCFDAVYSVDPHAFARQLDWLVADGWRTLRLRDVDARVPDRAIVITFDDGDISDLDIALPLLTRRGMTAEFFITADFVGRPGRLGPADLRALAAAGMGIQSHGCTHRYLDDLSDADMQTELLQSKRGLEALVGMEVSALALPGGRGGDRVRAAAWGMGYRYILNSEPGCNAHWQGGYLQRLAITRELPLHEFAQLVQWRGLRPHVLRARYRVLAQTKRLLGNRRYERFRARLLTP
jgi:peptidoglycan/xylan/chitin deacetylase (PgdA/CDA1 family)